MVWIKQRGALLISPMQGDRDYKAGLYAINHGANTCNLGAQYDSQQSSTLPGYRDNWRQHSPTGDHSTQKLSNPASPATASRRESRAGLSSLGRTVKHGVRPGAGPAERPRAVCPRRTAASRSSRF